MLIAPETMTRIRYPSGATWTLGDPSRPAGLAEEIRADVEPVSHRWAVEAGMASDSLLRLISHAELRGPAEGQLPDRILYAGATWDVVDVQTMRPMYGDPGAWEAVVRRVEPLEVLP